MDFSKFSEERLKLGGITMENIFDFDGVEKSELAIKKTWGEFREALSKGLFTYDEVDKAKEMDFLKSYDDLFRRHGGIDYNTLTLGSLVVERLGRGTILNEIENPDYERFMPNKRFIKEDNRFSPPGVEWLYLAIGNDSDIYECAVAECRGQRGQRFGFCHFELDTKYKDCKLVDLTIADDITYDAINRQLSDYVQTQIKKRNKMIKRLGYAPNMSIVNKKEFENIITKWGGYVYTKLLSEQIFEPLDVLDNKAIVYAPFQTMAQYYISLGYSGIIYSSTVCPVGKNLVLFDKLMAKPTGKIEDRVLP